MDNIKFLEDVNKGLLDILDEAIKLQKSLVGRLDVDVSARLTANQQYVSVTVSSEYVRDENGDRVFKLFHAWDFETPDEQKRNLADFMRSLIGMGIESVCNKHMAEKKTV